MATWITHIRIAEHFMNIDGRLNNIDFLVGNIAPDCGVPDENGKLIPDKSVTHWKSDGKDNFSEDFKNKYLKDNDSDFAFYLGYYFHLLTDNAWKYYPLKGIGIIDRRMTLDKNLTWDEIKKDWYGQDFLFLQNNPDFIFFTMFKNIKEYTNRYFDFYPSDIFSISIEKINNFYLNKKEDAGREFPYLTKSDVDSFVNSTIIILEKFYKEVK